MKRREMAEREAWLHEVSEHSNRIHNSFQDLIRGIVHALDDDEVNDLYQISLTAKADYAEFNEAHPDGRVSP